MDVLNRVLSLVGARVNRVGKINWSVHQHYRTMLKELRRKPPGRFPTVVGYFEHDVGTHPASYADWECSFCASHIRRVRPEQILDVGSYRAFILGLLAHYTVTTVDVRDREPMASNETVITCDAKNLLVADGQFDVVTSLCALEHFGLGRYGDEIDLDADRQAVSEMVRVLKPGGRLILTTIIRNGEPILAFNAHRVYNYELIASLFSSLVCEDERVFSTKLSEFCSVEEYHSRADSRDRYAWDVYCGCWIKTETPRG